MVRGHWAVLNQAADVESTIGGEILERSWVVYFLHGGRRSMRAAHVL